MDTLKRFVTRFRAGGGETSVPPPGGTHAVAERRCIEGAQHLAAGRLPDAERALADALECRHDYAEALLLQAIVYKRQGRLEDATDSLVLAEHFKPELAEVHFQLGLIAAAQGNSTEAERLFRRAVVADPRHAQAHNALGAVLFKARSLQEAAECFSQALAIAPDYAQAHSNLGCLLVTRLDRFDEGAAHIETAWRLEPQNQSVLCNWALLLQQRGRLSESLALWTRVVETGEDAEMARLNRALVLLKQGEFARGWPDYEARKRTESEYVPRDFPYPEWKGESLAGRTILVHAEQGIGDQIMFASCIPDLVLRAGHCVVECAPKLVAIFQRSFPAVTAVNAEEVAAGGDWRARVPAIDYHVALGSLPLRFRNSPRDFPDHDGYLRADAGKTAAWQRRLAELPGRRKIGLSWRGGMKHTRQSVRSVTFDQWLPIFRDKGMTFVSLQYTDCRAELAEMERNHGIRVFHWQEAIDDYDETAALTCALDLVISVQTSIVHLGGALGRPVWVMVPAVAEWRYLQHGESIPWYPSVRVWRQSEPGEWRPVIETIAGELARFCHEK